MNREGLFNGEEDIDKSKISISAHAVERFVQHSEENRQKVPDDYSEAEKMLRSLLMKADHKNAVSKVKRVKSIIDYKEEQFFFRKDRWQFIVARAKEDPSIFILRTVIWLDPRSYSLCFKKK